MLLRFLSVGTYWWCRVILIEWQKAIVLDCLNLFSEEGLDSLVQCSGGIGLLRVTEGVSQMTRVIAKKFLANTVGLNSPTHPRLDQISSAESVLNKNGDFLEKRLESFSLSVRGEGARPNNPVKGVHQKVSWLCSKRMIFANASREYEVRVKA